MYNRLQALAAVGAIVISLLVAGNVLAQDKKPAAKPDKALLAESAAVQKIVDGAMKGQPAPSDFKFTFVNHSMKSRDGKAWVPFILTFDKGQALPATITYYVRAVDKASAGAMEKAKAAHAAKVEKAALAAKLDPENAELAEAETKLRSEGPKVEYAFEDLKIVNFGKSDATTQFRFPAAMMAAAGDYDVYIVVKEATSVLKDKKAQPRATMMKVSVTVPNYFTDELCTSSVIVTNVVEQMKTQPTDLEMLRNPYIFGLTKAAPPIEAKFAKSDELSILFYIYNMGFDKTTGKPDVTVDYAFYQKTAGAEKFFNRTPQLILNGTTLPASFDLKLGHQLLGGQGVPLASFPEGDYRVELKIVDKVTGKTKLENALFTVTAG
jgi:hypothetical protein